MAREAESTFYQGLESQPPGIEEIIGPLPFSVRTTLKHLFDYYRQRLQSAPLPEKKYLAELVREMEAFPALLADDLDPEVIRQHQSLFGQILNAFFPLFNQTEPLGFIGTPFSQQILYLAPALSEIYGEENVEIGFNMPKGELRRYWILNASRFLMAYYYGHQVPPEVPAKLTVRSPKTGLQRYFGLNIITDFAKPQCKGPVPDLPEETIRDLIHHPGDLDRWLNNFPLEQFEFTGVIFVLLAEITEQEILTQIKNLLLENKMQGPQEDLVRLQGLLRCFFQRPALKVGLLGTDAFFRKLHPSISRQLSILGAESALLYQKDFKGSTYAQAGAGEKPLVVEDLTEWPHPTALEDTLKQQGLRSLLLLPIKETGGELAGLVEIGDPEPGVFNQATTVQIRELIPLLILGVLQKREMIESRIRATVQQQFTNIHPSVLWRFEEAAIEWLIAQQTEGSKATLPDIVFHGVYPLYGQADIVGSSTQRYDAIRRDLIDNLDRIGTVLGETAGAVISYLIPHYLRKVKTTRDRLKEYFSSSDESEVIYFIRNEVHPFLKQLAADHRDQLEELIQNYFTDLDPHLGIIYHRRKDYESSITRLNREISQMVETADLEMQGLLPHFFEKYATDGIEFNLYLGQALLPDRRFSPFHLREFRLWQLVLLCRITRRVAALQEELPLPLNTAQLLFAYSDPMDISFRMEEKQFDVEGAYNVRYEILKKRIDKSVIEGTGERLRAVGKIAIVYLHERDRREYLEYLHHLSAEGWTTGDPEELRLAPVQGVEGLRALRVTVAM